ncbi:unnamed protein product, partial [Nesidiocoris tenuis]
MKYLLSPTILSGTLISSEETGPLTPPAAINAPPPAISADGGGAMPPPPAPPPSPSPRTPTPPPPTLLR